MAIYLEMKKTARGTHLGCRWGEARRDIRNLALGMLNLSFLDIQTLMINRYLDI